VKAQGKELNAQINLKAVNARKIHYGKTETKRAIANVLMRIISEYKFTSLTALNSVLKLYNVAVDRGEKGSRTFLNNGLFYRILDENGNKTGVPIKASSIYMKPTLAYLENKFEENKLLKKPHEKRIKTAIDWVINQKNLNISDFKAELEKENINTAFWKNKENTIYGITYVDHKTKCVFNGSELGKKYSAKAIIENCEQELKIKDKVRLKPNKESIPIERNDRIISSSLSSLF